MIFRVPQSLTVILQPEDELYIRGSKVKLKLDAPMEAKPGSLITITDGGSIEVRGGKL